VGQTLFVHHDVSWRDVAWAAVLGIQCTVVARVVLRSTLGGMVRVCWQKSAVLPGVGPLSLARAIVKNAPILILDEATSAVDNETEAAIQHALADFAQDRTLLIIAHRLSTIRHADWIYVMGEGGMVVEEGTHQELLERDGVYASLWRLQIGDAMT
jgi:ABC-type phosphate/phosphonate transport system ATPase subunit